MTAGRGLRVRAALHTDVGMVRERNEDAAYADPQGQFFIVADGMGGHASGDVAAQMARDVIRERLEAARAALDAYGTTPTLVRRKRLEGLLTRAVQDAHDAIFERGRAESDKRGMGTTLEVVVVAGARVFVVHVGDSRTYVLRDGLAVPVTRDHTMAYALETAGKLTAEEARVSPMASMLVNAVGVTADVTIDIAHLELRDGDRILLCSDGLYDYFEPEELAERLCRGAPRAALAAVVELAKDRGGHDNITGVMIEASHAGVPVAAGTARPRVTVHDTQADPWDDETTIPHAGHPFSSVTEDSFVAFLDGSLRDVN